MRQKKLRRTLFTVILLIITIYTFLANKDNRKMYSFSGVTMGTIAYQVKVVSSTPLTLQPSIDSILVDFNQIFSTYQADSEISLVNSRGFSDHLSPLFYNLLKSTQKIHADTDGVFDPSLSPLINAWGFGEGAQWEAMDSAVVDSLLQFVGFDKISFTSQKLTMPPHFSLNFSAIAKGLAVDEVGEWLESRKLDNYMVEIGGEVRCKGKNAQSQYWEIGIEAPNYHSNKRALIATVSLENKSVATSGNYRNYYKKNNQMYTHILDPRHGFPVVNSIQSVSVFSSKCKISDAYATAFMVLGLEASKEILKRNQDLDAFFVYQLDDELKTYCTPRLSHTLEIKNAL